jgi:hypothetical protein
MAYSKIEQAYLDSLVQAQFPDPVEPEPVLLAENKNMSYPNEIASDTAGGAYVGTRLNMPKGLNTPENMQAVSNDIPKTVAGVAKGMAQGFVGLPGDLEGIGRLVLNYMGADVNEQTKLPTTQDVKGFLDQYIKLPELQTSDMSNFETAGEWLAPGGQLKAVRPVAKAIKGAVKLTEGLPVGLSTKAVGQGVDELGFYSAVSKAADEIQQPKGTGEQFLAQISKTPGVKQDEIMWTGLDDFLKSKKTVTKQEVQDYLANNRVDIKEVQLSDGGLKKKFSINSPEDQDFYDVIDKQGKVIFTGPEDEADYLLDRSMTKYSKYTMPGGDNYREVLLTLPKNSPEFKSGHFDESNILAHLRVNDRVDADGKKVLMVEEVQSDWHQSGRKKGYETPGNVEKLKQEVIVAKNELRSNEAELANKYGLPPKGDATTSLKDRMKWTQDLKSAMSDEEITARQAIEEKIKNAEQAWAMAGKGVPDAPFKNNWQELAMKRAIQMAAEGGYERIAFTTGKTQADRFDLSKQIDELMVTKNQDGTFSMEATLPNGGGIQTVGEDIPADKLDDIVGKDLANTIRKQESKGDVYSADDLRVGGEGMKGFYDNILPKFLDKYAKKWDAKTGMTSIEVGKGKPTAYADFNEYQKAPSKTNEPVHFIDITPKMRESVMTKGQPMFAIGAGGAGAATQQNQENK